MNTAPTEVAILERAHSLANELMFTVALQHRRLRTTEPEDDTFVMRWWADLQFLIVALLRLRRAAKVAAGVPAVKQGINSAIVAFNRALPGLARMRNVGEHLDEYAVDSRQRHDKTVSRMSLQVGSFDGATWRWAEIGQLNIDEALHAAEALHCAVHATLINYGKDA